MALAAGTKLGPYEIACAIGAGGMGEVYKAHDTKLGRDVAIKVLPEAFAHDSERLSRFQREAKMLAALNHPNIATIHGLEHSNSTHYLVMELVSGETLAERVKREGAVPVEEALKIAVQIAEALEAAHEKGIIHRDLKPANVKVTPEGKVKVLDFGLAKAFAGDVTDSNPSQSPTLSHAATMQGVILGTAAYMSPEQARGKEVDRRTDLWAFGSVLYELLTGKPAFEGESTTDILAAVVRAEPDWGKLPPSTPFQVRTLLKRCLQKEKTLRLQAAGDARIEIQEAISAPATAEPPAAVKTIRPLVRRALVLGFVVGVLAAAVAGLVTWILKLSPAPTAQPVTRTVIDLPPGQQLAGLGDGLALALSPDGTHLAYVARQNGTQQLYLRAMDGLETKPIAGTEGAVTPFFSPDSQRLGFFAGEKLKEVSVTGGAVLTVGDAQVARGASWSSQRMIALSTVNPGVLYQTSDAGGRPTALTRFEKGETDHAWPEFLPVGKTVVFAAGGGDWANSHVSLQSVETGERRNLIQGATHPRFALSGHLIYAQGGNLMAAPFDPQRLVLTGAAVPVVQDVLQSTSTGAAQYSLSSTGTLVYLIGAVQDPKQRKLVWVSRNGAERPLNAPVHAYREPRLSPDGRQLATAIDEQESQLWLYDFSRETLTRWTFEGNDNVYSAWTPDGKRIAFRSNRDGPLNIFWQLADGSGGLERLTPSEDSQSPGSWSPDGQLLVFSQGNPNTGSGIWVLNMKGHKAQPFLQTAVNPGAPRFSPDGRWLAYRSNASGRFEVYVQPYPGPGGKYQISTEGGTEPMWNPNGRELFYRSGDKMMVVDVTTQPSFSVGKPRMLFQGPYVQAAGTFPNYDVSADGQRFLMIKANAQEPAPTQINVVLNWFEELKQKVPTGKK